MMVSSTAAGGVVRALVSESLLQRNLCNICYNMLQSHVRVSPSVRVMPPFHNPSLVEWTSLFLKLAPVLLAFVQVLP
jgi:hypothetical protein